MPGIGSSRKGRRGDGSRSQAALATEVFVFIRARTSEKPYRTLASAFEWDGMPRWLESQIINNGILEGFNSLIQSAKAKARGYRTHKNFINMAYLILGKLDRLPT